MLYYCYYYYCILRLFAVLGLNGCGTGPVQLLVGCGRLVEWPMSVYLPAAPLRFVHRGTWRN